MTEAPAAIGRYRVEGVLGRGAMGVIYRAHDPEIDRPVAIKLVRADLLGGEDRADYLVRFRREAQAAGRCMHQNIVAVYDYALHEGNPFLAMEYVEGVSLGQALARGTRFAPDEAVFIVLQVLDALACAHALGVVHRDIKPANVLLLSGARVKVTDFGISRIDSAALTQDGSVIGTPSYMSPEQCMGRPVDARSDLFSTGTLLFELLSGEKPFPGRSFSEVMQALLNQDPPDLRTLVPEVSEALAQVVRRALTKPVEARYGSAAEMAEALRAAPRRGPSDGTIVAPRPGAKATLDTGQIGGIERVLAEYVGPIARLMVSSAVRKASTLEGLCDTLAMNITQEKDRQAFLDTVLRGSLTGRSRTQGAPPARTAIPAEEAERAQQELARYLGPIARILVRRAMATSRSVEELWDALAAHIERSPDRAAFLARRPRA